MSVFFDELLGDFVNLWWTDEDSMDDIPQHGIIAIFPVSYCCNKPDELCLGTASNLLEVATHLDRKSFLSPTIVFSSCSYPFPGAAEREVKLKRDRFMRLFPKIPILVAEPMDRSTQEARNVRDVLRRNGIAPEVLICVTGQMHSRRERLILKHFFPRTTIFMFCTSYRYETQPDHPVSVQRSSWKWLLNNMLGYYLLKIPGGFWIMDHLPHHRVAKQITTA